MSEYWIWFLLGISFFIVEFIMPNFILFFFGLGAWIVSIILGLELFDLSFNQQIILFTTSSILFLFLLRNYFKNIFLGKENKGKDNYSDPSDNEENFAIVTKKINTKGFGEIKYKGTFYMAKSDQNIDQGENVKVIGKGDEQGSFYIVKKND